MAKKLQKINKKLKILNFFKKIKQILQKNIISIHPLSAIIGLVFFMAGRLKMVFIYAMVVILHELTHFFVSKKMGYICHKIKLMPYGAVLDAETDDFSFKDEIIIAISGPIFNFIMCAALVCLWWAFPVVYNYTDEFLLYNLIMGIFNLLPIFPLDGGRILLAVLSAKNGRANSVKLMKIITAFFGAILFAVFVCSLFFVSNLTIGTIGLMLVCSAFFTDKQTRFERVSYFAKKVKKAYKGLIIKPILVSESASLRTLLKMVDDKTFACFNVCDSNLIIKKVVYESDLENMLLKYSLGTKIIDAI